MRKILIALLVSALSVITVGCGDGGDDGPGFTADGGTVVAPTTGNVTFNFVRAQTINVPTGTTSLRFDFYDAANTLLFTTTRPFASQVTIEGVPNTATRADVTSLNNLVHPVSVATGAITVTAGITTIANLTNVTAVTFTTLTVQPSPVNLTNNGTQQLVLQATFSNGAVVTLDPSGAVYGGNNAAIATVSNAGVVTGVIPVPFTNGALTTNLNVAYTLGTTTRNANVTINVTVNQVSLGGVNTFDTTTGFLNGAAHPGWNGTILTLESLTLAGGATLNVTGTQAFQLVTTGNIAIDGTLNANGGNGANGFPNQPGRAGGTAGPGGFAGGDSGGNDGHVGDMGAGPGGGGGGNVDGATANSGGGGGGGGHLAAGAAGGSSNGIAGAAGALYLSIPTNLIGGSGGGGGSAEDDPIIGVLEGGDDSGGGGGGGGGAVRMTAGGTLVVSATGVINANGGDGGSAGGDGSGGGAGAGGSIELLAPAVPTNNGALNVNPGTPGTGNANGGAGSVGRTRVATI